MKKLYAIILASLMVVTLASCSKEQSKAYDLYLQATEAMSQADAIAMDMTMDMTMSAQGETIDMQMASQVKQIMKSETDMEMEMRMTLAFDGEEMPVTAYYLDGMYYMDMMGLQYKMAMPMDEALEQAQTEVIEFPEDAVLEQKAEKNGDDTTLTFKLKGSALDEVLAGQMSGLTDSMGLDTDALEMTFGDVTLTAVIGKDGNFKSMRMEFSYSMDMEGETVSAVLDTTMENFQIGGVTIEFPENLDDYMDMSGMLG